jgi:hypothetical protein
MPASALPLIQRSGSSYSTFILQSQQCLTGDVHKGKLRPHMLLLLHNLVHHQVTITSACCLSSLLRMRLPRVP